MAGRPDGALPPVVNRRRTGNRVPERGFVRFFRQPFPRRAARRSSPLACSMATTHADLKRHLDALNLAYTTPDDETVVLGFETERYVNPEGDQRVLIVCKLDENGEFVSFFAPGAFVPSADHLDVFLRACMIVQWETKLIQFEFDRTSSEVTAVVEIPVEDSELTERQVRRCVTGLVNLLDEFYEPLRRAAEDGEIDFSQSDDVRIESLAEFLASFPPDVLAEALTRADEKMRNRPEGGDEDEAEDDDESPF